MNPKLQIQKTLDNKNELREGILTVIKGNVLGYIKRPWISLEEIPSRLDFKDLLRLEGNYIAKVDYNGVYLIYPSITGAYDFFYYYDGTKLIYNTDLIELVCSLEKVIIDMDEKTFFIEKGYTRPGSTIFENIYRVPLGKALYINGKENCLVDLEYQEWEIDYPEFKKSFINSINMYNPMNNDAILFSGGKDSSAILLTFLEELGVTPIIATAHYINPIFTGNEQDISKVNYYRNKFSLNSINVEIDLDHIDFHDLLYLVKKMPLAAHSSVVFDSLVQDIKRKGLSQKLWTGQNADSVYGLGHTSDRIGGIIGRYLLSDYFISSFKDTKNNQTNQLLGNCIRIAYQLRRHCCVDLPRTCEEYIDAFLLNPQYLPLHKFKNRDTDFEINKKTINYVRQQLFDAKQNSHMIGRDHRIIQYAGDSSIERIFPYSNVAMLLVFRNLKIKKKDIFKGKRYIGDFIKEHLGKKDYKNLYPSEWHIILDNREEKFYQEGLDLTMYGKTLKECITEHISDKYNLQESISMAWYCELLNILRQRNVKIQENQV